MEIKQIKKLVKNKFFWLVLIFFGLIFLSRFLFLSSDLPSTHVEIEEKFGGYNARNMVLLKHWPSYENWFQPMVWAPIQNLLSFVSFKIFGVGLAQFRFPMVLASFIGLIFFFIILLKQTDRKFALFGLLAYAFCFEFTVWGRSGLCENLYLLFMPLATYFLTKNFSQKQIFFFILFAGLDVVAKLDGYPFFGSAIIFLFLWSLKTHSFKKIIKPVILGAICSLVVLVFLYLLSDSFKYFLSTYSFYFQIMVKESSFINGIVPSFNGFMDVLLKIDPYIFLALLISIPVFVINYHRLNKVDCFIFIYLIVVCVTRLQIPFYLVYWKRTIIMFYPFFYVVFRTLFLLWNDNEISVIDGKRKGKTMMWLLYGSSIYSIAIIFVFLNFFNKSIIRIYNFHGFFESFHYSGGSFAFLSIVFILGIIAFNLFILIRSKKISQLLTVCISFFVLISFSVNFANVIKIFIPQNIRYSYQDNLKFAKLLPKEGIIISHEQGFRAFAYLTSNDFYFNADGGPNPVEYREVLERPDLRYFITNVEEFTYGRWGLSNKYKLGLIKQTYPNLKLLGVIFASRVPLAIYDKYGK